MTPENMPKPRRAFAYLRVSGKGQVEGDGFPRQRAAIEGYAQRHSIKIVRWFQEKGVSGTKDAANRPALTEMMAELFADGVRLALVEKLDRLARDLMVQENIIADFKRHSVELISVHEPDLCSDDATRVMMRQIFGSVAQYEKTQIVAKLRAARIRAKAKTGRCEGRKPFGFREGEPDTLARMRKLAAQGMNYTQIAETLNKAGVKTRYGSAWFPATVSRILRNED